MNPNEYAAALRTAGEIVNRYSRGVPNQMLVRGIPDVDVARVAFWLLKADEVLSVLGNADDPLEPHRDPMRNEKDGVA